MPTVDVDDGVSIASFTEEDIPVFFAICATSDCNKANRALARSR